MATIPFTYIDTSDALEAAARAWNKVKHLAVDIECENNLHHYGAYISLIQISDGKHNWLIDVLTLRDIKPLIDVFHNPDVEKIFHDIGFDFRILYDMFKCHPKPVFDTQIAALLLGKENIGLGSLLEKYLGIKKESKFQMADWTKRPLSEKMLSYAAQDTFYLIQLRSILQKELKEKGRWKWAEEEFKDLEAQTFTYKEQGYLDLKGIRELSEKQLGIAKQLFQLQKELMETLHLIQKKIAEKTGIKGHLVMDKEQIGKIASGDFTCLRNWQRELDRKEGMKFQD